MEEVYYEVEKPNNVEKHRYQYYDEGEGCNKLVFEDIKLHNGLILKHRVTGNKILIPA